MSQVLNIFGELTFNKAVMREKLSNNAYEKLIATIQSGSPLDQSIAEHRSNLAVIDQTLARRRADLDATRQQVEKLRRTLPLITQRADSMAKLADQKLFPQMQYLEVEQLRIEAEQDLIAGLERGLDACAV